MAAAPPAADTAGSVSYSTWTITPEKVILKFVLPVGEAQRLTGTKMSLATIDRLKGYLLKHTGVTTGQGENCPAMDQGYDLGRVDPLTVAPGFYGNEIFFKCAGQPDSYVFENHVLFDRNPRHVDFARIETSDGHFVSQVFTAGRQQLRVPATGAVPAAGIGRYVHLGFVHIRGSWDRLCLLLGLLLLMRRKEDLLYGGGGLIAGYSLALAQSATTLMMPRTALLEAFVGFLVALIGAELAAREADRGKIAALGSLGLAALGVAAAFAYGSRPALVLFGAALLTGAALIGAGRYAAWRTYLPAGLGLIFGYLDGFVLPVDLVPSKLSMHAVAWMAMGFDVGAALTCVALLLLAGGVLLLWRRREPVLPAALVHDFVAAGLGGLGVFWLLTRL